MDKFPVTITAFPVDSLRYMLQHVSNIKMARHEAVVLGVISNKNINEEENKTTMNLWILCRFVFAIIVTTKQTKSVIGC